jgi:lipopolysaccharide heptosyltransferase II
MEKIVIIKLGALGDVVRTTPLLRALQGKVIWVTSESAVPLLKDNSHIARLVRFEQAAQTLRGEEFDIVMNLEDELPAASLASSLRARTLVGAFLDQGRIAYSPSAAPWFDMSLISKFGKAKADELKMQNRRSYQDFLFEMVGRHFQGEEYVLTPPPNHQPVQGCVGIEARAGAVWPMKRWGGYDQLALRLEHAGFGVVFLRQHERLADYLGSIQECEYVVCGDTLAMHVGLALRKKLVAIFTCTSPYEIYGYQRMVKVVSPLWQEYFYRRDFVVEAGEAISVETVFDAVARFSKPVPEPIAG